ncbi:hypothetical protein [Lysobacter enzymogenes]|uniref:hypothetical protein n=1 Tax=Lysobacter enzymogenes TaxID=69 RepID=UPI0009CD926D|nr:hypothetical protein [Lysobacter enzymogenes]UZW60903.1 hypothetical protein BV903_001030 [Lysobacter enzymogenes]
MRAATVVLPSARAVVRERFGADIAAEVWVAVFAAAFGTDRLIAIFFPAVLPATGFSDACLFAADFSAAPRRGPALDAGVFAPAASAGAVAARADVRAVAFLAMAAPRIGAAANEKGRGANVPIGAAARYRSGLD